MTKLNTIGEEAKKSTKKIQFFCILFIFLPFILQFTSHFMHSIPKNYSPSSPICPICPTIGSIITIATIHPPLKEEAPFTVLLLPIYI